MRQHPSNRPILHHRPRHIGEIAKIVGNHRQPQREGMGGDQAVIAGAFERQRGIGLSRGPVEIEYGYTLDELIEYFDWWGLTAR